MKKYLEKKFTELPHGRFANNDLWRYRFLAIIVALFATSILLLITLPASYPYSKYSNLIVLLMLLLNHLAFQFKWPKMITIAMRVIAVLWMLFASLYLSYVLFS